MDILVNDTNIFIDLQSIGLLESMCKLPFEIHTVDFVIAEIIDESQASMIRNLVDSGKIHVHSFSGYDVAAIVMEHAGIRGNLSLPDVAVCNYAHSGPYKLITGDRQLRNYAEKKLIEVHGILYLFDKMVDLGIISSAVGASKLKELLEINVRLPKSEIALRIDRWKK